MCLILTAGSTVGVALFALLPHVTFKKDSVSAVVILVDEIEITIGKPRMRIERSTWVADTMKVPIEGSLRSSTMDRRPSYSFDGRRKCHVFPGGLFLSSELPYSASG